MQLAFTHVRGCDIGKLKLKLTRPDMEQHSADFIAIGGRPPIVSSIVPVNCQTSGGDRGTPSQGNVP